MNDESFILLITEGEKLDVKILNQVKNLFLPEREIKIRTNLMGWSPTSKTAETYNQRHIKEAAGVAMTAIQTRILERVK